jgi:hypothetical protein
MGEGAGVGGEAGKFKALLKDRVRGASTRIMPSSSWTSVLSVWMGERMLKGGESGATGPTMEAEGVGWCSVRIGLLSCVDASIEVDEEDDSGFERGDGVRGGLEPDGRGLK